MTLLDYFLSGILLIIIFWIIFLRVISYLSGWHTLKTNYQTSHIDNQIHYRGISGKIGKFRYNKILSVTLSETGLYLSVPLLFRIGHPLLLIPWANIKNIQEKDKIISCEVDGIPITISRKIYNIFKSYLSTFS